VIKLKRVYAPAAAEDGRRFLVDRLWPRGVRKDAAHIEAWLKDVGPSDTLRTWFGHDPQRWPEFQRRYRRELESRPTALAPLIDAARAGDITLVYGARDEEHNQAVVLKEVLDERLQALRSA
jgi:uncharacterized protein YeaO (DUF488 family)